MDKERTWEEREERRNKYAIIGSAGLSSDRYF